MRKSAPPPSRDSSADTVRFEREFLRGLCHARLTCAAWAKMEARLRAYAWQDAEHALVYAAALRVGAGDPAKLRAEIPAQATRMGFPDIDWAAYFGFEETRSRTLSLSEIGPHIRRLKKRPPKNRVAATKAKALRPRRSPLAG